jgi:hypothetical protein
MNKETKTLLTAAMKKAVAKWIKQDNAIFEKTYGEKNKCTITKKKPTLLEFTGIDRRILTDSEFGEFTLAIEKTNVVCCFRGNERNRWAVPNFIKIFASMD